MKTQILIFSALAFLSAPKALGQNGSALQTSHLLKLPPALAPQVSNPLELKVSAQSSGDEFSAGLGWTSPRIGAILILGAYTYLQNEASLDSSTAVAPNSSYLYAGQGLALLGTVAMAFYIPEQNSYFEFLSHHDNLNPEPQIQWQLGVGIVDSIPNLKLALLF